MINLTCICRESFTEDYVYKRHEFDVDDTIPVESVALFFGNNFAEAQDYDLEKEEGIIKFHYLEVVSQTKSRKKPCKVHITAEMFGYNSEYYIILKSEKKKR